jgi:hypothetical protein
MRSYHHLGIPSSEPRANEEYLPELKIWTSGFEASPFGVEWVRFAPDSPVPELVKTVPHVAFQVDDLASELEGKDVLIEPNSPSPGVMVAFIVDNGAPIELLQLSS